MERELEQIMRNNELKFSFWAVFRMIVPVLAYLVCFLVVFKMCSMCCKQPGTASGRRSRPNLARRNSAPAMIIVTNPPDTRRMTPVAPERRPPPTINSTDAVPEYQPQLPKAPELAPPSYEEATHLPSYNTRQLPYNPEFPKQ